MHVRRSLLVDGRLPLRFLLKQASHSAWCRGFALRDVGQHFLHNFVSVFLRVLCSFVNDVLFRWLVADVSHVDLQWGGSVRRSVAQYEGTVTSRNLVP